MKSRPLDPRRLNVLAFADDEGSLVGEENLADFARLRESVPPDAPPATAKVAWSARGERRKVVADEPQTWLHLRVDAAIWLECQRCLQPVEVPLVVDRSFRFVRGEDTAARLDADCEDDVLELEPMFDLVALIEDELLMALPIVPRHEDCAPAVSSVEPEEGETEKENPFAALAALKRSPPH